MSQEDLDTEISYGPAPTIFDNSPASSHPETAAMSPNAQEQQGHPQLMAVQVQQASNSQDGNVTLKSSNNVDTQETITGNIKVVVTATQYVTLSADRHSMEEIKLLALKEIARTGVKLKAIEVNYPDMPSARVVLDLGKHENLNLRMGPADTLITNVNFKKAEKAQQQRMKRTDSLLENHETSPTSGEIANGLTQEEVTHCPYPGLPLTGPPQKALLMRDADITATEQWLMLRRRRFSRSRARPYANMVAQAPSITRGIDSRKWKALRREEKLLGRNVAREIFNSETYGEHIVGERPKAGIHSRVTMKRVSGEGMRHVMSSFKTGQSASIRRRLDEADKQRWMGHGNTLSHEKKMEAIVKELETKI